MPRAPEKSAAIPKLTYTRIYEKMELFIEVSTVLGRL